MLKSTDITPAQDAAQLIDALRRRSVSLVADRGTIKVAAPKGVVTPDDADSIRRFKSEILDLLGRERALEGPIARQERGEPLPLGYVQHRIWVHNQIEPDTSLYNLPGAWELKGPLDREALSRAFSAFLARHEIMRMVVSQDTGLPAQSFTPVSSFELGEDDLSLLPADEQTGRMHAVIAQLRDVPIDLESGEPFRARLFRLAQDRHVLFLLPHHLVWDGWSFDIFLRELGELYACERTGRASNLPAITTQYADYAVWHRAWMESGVLDKEVDYWTRELEGDIPPLEFPIDHPRPRHFTHRGDWEEFELAPETVVAIGRLASDFNATPFMVLLSVWFAFLSRICGQDDMIVGVPIQARQHSDVADLIGCFVNTICIRQKIDPDLPFIDFLDSVRAASVQAFEHQEAPIELLIERLLTERDASRTPLFQTMFTHQQVSGRSETFDDLELGEWHINPASAPTDLGLDIMEGSSGAHAVLHYSTDLFASETVHRLRLRLTAFLEAVLDAPGSRICDLPIITAEEHEYVVVALNDTASDYPRDARAHDAFLEWARLTPHAIAAACAGEEVTYGDLEERSAAIALRLRAAAAGPGDLVGIYLERSVDLLAAVLAVWRSGAACLPLDPNFPQERLAYMLDDSGARFLLTTRDLDERPATQAMVLEIDGAETSGPDALPPAPSATGHLAYVLYTSGSTGKPKGVEIEHRSLVNFLTTMAERPGLSENDRLLAVTTLSFDISFLELILPLFVGARVVIAESEDVLDGFALVDLIDEHAITTMQATPATWRLLIESEWEGTPRLKALCGGEALTPALARELLPRCQELWNMYGPTETTIWSTCQRILEPESITVGRPIANTSIYILDDRGEPLPPGIAGELWIGGDGLARGYLDKPELTAERFRPDPFSGVPGARMYRTGDWARLRPDGAIEFQSRRDNQVKVRGFRIELGEIEHGLDAHPAIAQSVVVVRHDDDSDAKIVAYIVLQPDAVATGSELRRWLRQSLPDYMVPHIFVEMPALPLTNNGKIDRKALPPPEAEASVRQIVPPSTDIERAIAGIWQELLDVGEISIGDNFLDLGGHSIQAAQMVARVRKHCGHRIPVRAVIFETLEQLAQPR